jgi:CRP-like cAMP-binding protein
MVTDFDSTAPGQSGQQICVVVSGVINIQIYRADDEREAILVDMLGEKDVFGWLGFLCGLQEMQHIAYTEVEYVALDLETIFRAVDNAPKSSAAGGSGGGEKEGDAEDADAEPKLSMRTFDKVLFFKVLALILSEKFQHLKQENIRSCNRLIQTDEQESLREEIQKQELRMLCIRKFGLPDTDQVT